MSLHKPNEEYKPNMYIYRSREMAFTTHCTYRNCKGNNHCSRFHGTMHSCWHCATLRIFWVEHRGFHPDLFDLDSFCVESLWRHGMNIIVALVMHMCEDSKDERKCSKIYKKFCSRFLCLQDCCRNNVTRWTCNSFLINISQKKRQFLWKSYLLTCHGILKRRTRSIWAASYSQVSVFMLINYHSFIAVAENIKDLFVGYVSLFVTYLVHFSTTDPRHSPERWWVEPHPYRTF